MYKEYSSEQGDRMYFLVEDLVRTGRAELLHQLDHTNIYSLHEPAEVAVFSNWFFGGRELKSGYTCNVIGREEDVKKLEDMLNSIPQEKK